MVEVVQFGRFCTCGRLVKAVLGREGIHLRARLLGRGIRDKG